jgi:hypothetical protein
MKIWIYRFTAKQLRSIPKVHLGFIVASSHCCNELTSISPYMMFEHDFNKANEVEKAFMNLRLFTLIRFQIAKTFEYRELFNGYMAQSRKTYPAMSEKLGKRFKEISRQISSATWVERLRNRVAFHFDPEHALQSLNAVSDQESLEFIVGSMRGVTAINFAERALLGSLLSDAGGGDQSKGMDVVLGWTLKLHSLITTFHAETMEELFTASGLLQKREEGELRDSYCAARGSMAIPLSVLEPHRS